MVNPISNQMFSHDFPKFVFQPQDVVITPPVTLPPKAFSVKNTKKTKKDIQKEKSPWEVKKPNQNSGDSKDSV